jgi:hypothetical protein
LISLRVINLVDVTPGEDFFDGLAILSSPADHMTIGKETLEGSG